MSLSMPFNAVANIPGSSAEKFPEQVTFLQGRVEKSQIYQGVIDSLARDAGNTADTTILRMGLLLGRNASNELVHFDPAASPSSNSTKNCEMILATDLSMKDGNAVANKFTGELYGGGVIDPNKIVLASSSSVGIVGNDYEYHIRKLLAAYGDFVMEDNLVEPPLFAYKGTKKHSDLTGGNLEETDRDYQYTNAGESGAVTFTLPDDPHKDLAYYFYVEADANVIVTATATEMFALNNAAATSVAFSTSSQKIGGALACIGDGSKWKIHNMSAGANTITVA